MMKIFSFIVSALLFVGCSTLDVSVDYDESYDFKSAKSFAVDNSVGSSQNTLFGERVVNALNSELTLKNYTKSSKEEADLIFVFHASAKEKSDVQTSIGMSGYRGYRYGGMMMSTTHTYEYKEGTLVVDALSPKTKKVVWRGIGVKELSEKETPQERTKAVNAAVKKIMEKFPTK
ncbi:MAG: DUF4136 domain-containing protein [Campylobacterota bacterium]|nr:DUF4136 domain-containing protein [Campylobacterota bacterium]